MNDSEINITRFSISKTQQRLITYFGRCLFLLISASLFLLFSCDREDMFTVSLDAMKYTIGDTGPGGGTVFYITDGGFHGMEVAPSGWYGGSDPTSAWSTITNIAIGVAAQGTVIGTGSLNTSAIKTQNGGAASTAQLCRDYTGGGKSDWFLPSKDELNAIWVNLVDDGFAANSGVGGFFNGDYWSSSEVNNSYTWGQSFSNGFQSSSWAKSVSTLYVRPVRKF
jgi:hypothetical protein